MNFVWPGRYSMGELWYMRDEYVGFPVTMYEAKR